MDLGTTAMFTFPPHVPHVLSEPSRKLFSNTSLHGATWGKSSPGCGPLVTIRPSLPMTTNSGILFADSA